MQGGRLYRWAEAHLIDAIFAAIALFWLWYLLRVSKDQSYWSDDLMVVRQASRGGFLEPYATALSAVSMIVDRVAIAVGHFAYWPFTLAGLLALLSVPVAYFVTTRRFLGPALSGVLAMSLMWFHAMSPRPAALNHFLVLTMAIVCAAALNRGPRANWFLAIALTVALAAGGGGLVVVLACLVHSALTRPPWRRWLAIVGPLLLYLAWYAVHRPAPRAAAPALSARGHLVWDLLTVPFYQLGFSLWPLAAVLAIAYLWWGVHRLRRGVKAGLNFIVWNVAFIAWPMALIQVRGTFADATTYRYALVSLGFMLLAVVPNQPITWPPLVAPDRRALAIGAVALLLVAGARAGWTRPSLDSYSRLNTDRGRKVEAALRVTRLEPPAIPSDTPLVFFGFSNPHGTAGQLRQLLDEYGAPYHPTPATIDEDLLDLGAVSWRLPPKQRPPATCHPVAEPLTLAPTSIGESNLGVPPPTGPGTNGPAEYDFWSKDGFTVEFKRFGDHFVHVVDVPPSRDLRLTLPLLSSGLPYQVRVDGACLRS